MVRSAWHQTTCVHTCAGATSALAVNPHLHWEALDLNPTASCRQRCLGLRLLGFCCMPHAKTAIIDPSDDGRSANNAVGTQGLRIGVHWAQKGYRFSHNFRKVQSSSRPRGDAPDGTLNPDEDPQP